MEEREAGDGCAENVMFAESRCEESPRVEDGQLRHQV